MQRMRTSRVRKHGRAIQGMGGKASAIAFDVVDGAASRAAWNCCWPTGPIQILVNNAGITMTHPCRDERGAMAGVDRCLAAWILNRDPALAARWHARASRIVSVSSVAAAWAIAARPITRHRRPRVHGASKSLAREMASRGHHRQRGLRGMIEGSSWVRHSTRDVKAIVRQGLSANPRSRRLVRFLCSDEAATSIGQVIGINGWHG